MSTFFDHSRTPNLNDLEENSCHAAWSEFCKTHPVSEQFDLSISNVTKVGFKQLDPPEVVAHKAITDHYEASSQGLFEARKAISDYYKMMGCETVDPEHVQLFASTSEAIGALLKLVCQPGDEVITFTPTYPLLDCLTSLESVNLREVLLQDCADEWAIDFYELARQYNEKTRAIIVVSPNNPTGHCLRREEFNALLDFCADRGIILIVDEVFASYMLVNDDGLLVQPAAIHAHKGLVVSLSGFSKVCGLPQHKLGWGIFGGAPELIDEAMQRMSFITDSTLSVSGWVQHISTYLLSHHAEFSNQCIERLKQNMQTIHEIQTLPDTRWKLAPVHGGWNVCLRLPKWAGSDEDFAESLAQCGIRVFPGTFFGFRESNPTLVLSLIIPPETFKLGLIKLTKLVSDRLDA